ncbi:NADPH quinone reductase MdaB [Campylobacter sp. MIT 99-7217]|uniref:NAD(P)H-dependent oxidoreductase n=1 Tax=Campylobacter sp. MIT 99-7217 TaxID=535091 RepID=UPI00115BA450|nr:NAD(P)H-dependent oxidoreductase [Campylobacter sp. MIT 99-7217]TQR31320.1 NADPH quinone reductase MdaB [Campylobacter sp. MIT 99-7217]
MKTALLLNGSKVFDDSKAKLSATLQEVAKTELENRGYKIIQTHIDKGYNEDEEVQKWLDSELAIWQLPAWWMGEPWIVKKYIDTIFTTKGFEKFFISDGRHRDNPDINYGKGGLMQGKKVMLSVTWNAPLRAFTDKNEFFEGKGVEAVYFHFHKIHEFIGMTCLPTFMCNDVVKNPQISKYIEDYKTHLARVLD